MDGIPQYLRESHPSIPPYPIEWHGDVIVCGSAESLREDLRSVERSLGVLPILTVNKASQWVPGFAQFSCHSKAMLGKGWLNQPFGGNHVTSHACAKDINQAGRRCKHSPYIDHWWVGVNNFEGTSGWAAAKVALLMGFSRAILCGVQIENMNYADGERSRAFEKRWNVRKYRNAIEQDTEWHPFIRSASGWTKDLLGGFDG